MDDGTNGVGPWTGPLQILHEALGRGDVPAAREAWRAAYLYAWQSPGWEGLAEVGDAYLRIGEASGDTASARRLAVGMYGRALIRASQSRSGEGILRLRDAFVALGAERYCEEYRRVADYLLAQRVSPPARSAASEAS
jgi:hypothetical protein